MIPIAALREMSEFNYWARDRQLETCSQLSSEQFLRPMGSSHSSVRDSLAHLLFAEWIWHERWLGGSPTRQDAEAYAAAKFPTLDSIRAAWVPVEKGVRDFLQTCPEEKLLQPLTYTNTQGKLWTYPLGRAMFHLANHQTYHRGQVATLLRQLGVVPPPIDYLVAYDSGSLK